MKHIPYVMVNLIDIPMPGKVQIVVRIVPDDSMRIHEAAAALGMSLSIFTRTVLVRAADKILEEVLEEQRKESLA